MKANLTGEQCRVLLYLLSREEVAEDGDMPESNVSRGLTPSIWSESIPAYNIIC